MSGETSRFWFVRHAPVESGGRLYGQEDLPARITDTKPADCLRRGLPSAAAWIVTPLRRTQETADAIRGHRETSSSPHASSPAVEPGFLEQHFGVWQGYTIQTVMDNDPERWAGFWEDPAESRPPGGESFADVVGRVRPALTRIAESSAGRDIVVIAHGGSIRAALAVAMDLSPAQALSVVVDTWSLTRLDHIAGAGPHGMAAWRIAGVNIPATGIFHAQ